MLLPLSGKFFFFKLLSHFEPRKRASKSFVFTSLLRLLKDPLRTVVAFNRSILSLLQPSSLIFFQKTSLKSFFQGFKQSKLRMKQSQLAKSMLLIISYMKLGVSYASKMLSKESRVHSSISVVVNQVHSLVWDSQSTFV